MKKYLIGILFALLSLAALGQSNGMEGTPQTPIQPGPSTSTTPANVTAAGATAAGSVSSLQAIANTINRTFGGGGEAGMMERFKSKGLAIASGLGVVAKALAGVLALVSLVWAVLIAMASNQSSIDAAVESIIFATITAFLLFNYPSIVNDVMTLAASVSSSVGIGGVGEAVSEFIRGFFFVFVDTVVKGISGLSFTDWVLKAADLIVGVLLMLIACFFAFTALIELIGVLLIGPVVVGLAIAVGPIFVACIASPYTRRWFDQWLNFLIGGAFLSVITLIVLTLLNAVVTVQITQDAGGSLAGQALAVALLGMGCAKIFAAIPGLADSLFPGRTGAGKAVVSSKDMGQAAKAVPAAAGAASSAGGAAKGAVVSAVTKFLK